MNSGIETVVGLVAVTYLFSYKSDVDRLMENATRPVVSSCHAMLEAEKRTKEQQRQKDQDQYERIGKLLAHLSRLP